MEDKSATYLGIDFGTSGARAIAIDQQEKILSQIAYPISEQTPTQWRELLLSLLAGIPLEIRQRLRRLALNGTSATVLMCDRLGQPVSNPLMYNDSRGQEVLTTLKKIAPSEHTVISATSSLAKLLWWEKEGLYQEDGYFLHQADWLAFLLHQQLGISDYHNALKLGYDVESLAYPQWFPPCSIKPRIVAPGAPVAPISPPLAHTFQIPLTCLICAGTTDSIAAFLASGAEQPGEAVTSLGSTLVLKLLSQTRVEHGGYGIYSHRLGNFWLAGGASNTGGEVLGHFFTPSELQEISKQINPEIASPYYYYPLLKPGDRFPINDANLAPQLEPKPENRQEFLHGLLESIARLEKLGYERLSELGANRVQIIYTAGGGAKNLAWGRIRARVLGVEVKVSPQTEAAYGTALLAKNGLNNFSSKARNGSN